MKTTNNLDDLKKSQHDPILHFDMKNQDERLRKIDSVLRGNVFEHLRRFYRESTPVGTFFNVVNSQMQALNIHQVAKVLGLNRSPMDTHHSALDAYVVMRTLVGMGFVAEMSRGDGSIDHDLYYVTSAGGRLVQEYEDLYPPNPHPGLDKVEVQLENARTAVIYWPKHLSDTDAKYMTAHLQNLLCEKLYNQKKAAEAESELKKGRKKSRTPRTVSSRRSKSDEVRDL